MSAEINTSSPPSSIPQTYPISYTFKIFRGNDKTGEFVDYEVSVDEGMVVLDAILSIQENQDTELAVRWNCKSGRCGSCGMEVNGMPKLACMTRLSDFDPKIPITVTPMKTFPILKDLVSDVSWNYEVNKTIQPFSPDEDSDFIYQQEDIERSREFRKCIECFLCQDVCHVLREHDKKDSFGGPRFFVRSAALHFHPERREYRRRYRKRRRSNRQRRYRCRTGRHRHRDGHGEETKSRNQTL